MSSSSWSNLPLDLLVSIKDKLQLSQRIDLTSFRSVCSHWSSAVPVPNPLPRYGVIVKEEEKTILFITYNDNDNDNKSTENRRFIYLPSPLSSSFCCFGSSNGWVVLITGDNIQTLHLFDPVSYRMLNLPPLSLKILRHYNKSNPTVRNASRLHFMKVIVSSSPDNGVAVAGIVQINCDTNLTVSDSRFVYCKCGDGQRWDLLFEKSKGIEDIAVTRDGRFFAVGKKWELYMVEERSSLITLKKFKLLIPKPTLEPDYEYEPTTKRQSTCCYGVDESGESGIKIYGYCKKYRRRGGWIILKVEVTNSCCRGNNVNVACEVEWCHSLPSVTPGTLSHFTPLLRKAPLKVQEQKNNG